MSSNQGSLNSEQSCPGHGVHFTIEPRKGYAHALAALEHLWSEGIGLNLVIVGREGWPNDSWADRAPVRALVERLISHPCRGQRLCWLPEADDRTLAVLYRRATALLANSENDGFGLLLVEAAHHGLPVIARDIPVFREIAGPGAYYLSSSVQRDPDGLVLAAELRAWRAANRDGAAPVLAAPTWRASAARLRELLLADWP